jgi:hypothetical protein
MNNAPFDNKFYYKDSHEFYNFKDPEIALTSDIKSLIHAIGLLGNDLVGIELGVFRAQSFCTILHNCSNVKTLYGIDSYLPYSDYLKSGYDGTPAYTMYEKDIELTKSIAYNKIKYSGMKEKVIFYEEDSNEAVKKFKNESIDFIFIDTYMTEEQAQNDLETWYPIIKKNGLFSGHDWGSKQIQIPVNKFREKNNITSNLCVFDNCWAWIK